ncbi:MAG TPA: hypothetical protein HPP77_05880 [Candidatus Hydrogenedentes bacterium]|nr:hypothetical protein [Candidatus Hydrogenedentota bacterium]HIJ73460.1 hypothetical protein [Candidatus Hydrogenedentota bacterium]
MSSEFELEEEPKDWTKWVWLGIGVSLAVMVLLLFLLGGPRKTNVSRVRVKHILIKFAQADPESKARAREQIVELRQRLLDGEDFGKLARQYSMDPQSSRRGGDLGYQNKGEFMEPFEEFVWNAEPGELSDVITTIHGYHLAVVVDRQWSDTDAYEKRIHEEILKGEKEGELAGAEE